MHIIGVRFVETSDGKLILQGQIGNSPFKWKDVEIIKESDEREEFRRSYLSFRDTYNPAGYRSTLREHIQNCKKSITLGHDIRQNTNQIKWCKELIREGHPDDS